MAEKRKGGAKLHERIAEVDEATIRLHMSLSAGGGYVATSRDVPGLVAESRSIMEAVEIAQGLTRKIVESCIEHGNPLPASPQQVAQATARFAHSCGRPLMGRLAGFKYREAARRLRAFGFVFDRPCPGQPRSMAERGDGPQSHLTPPQSRYG